MWVDGDGFGCDGRREMREYGVSRVSLKGWMKIGCWWVWMNWVEVGRMGWI